MSERLEEDWQGKLTEFAGSDRRLCSYQLQNPPLISVEFLNWLISCFAP